MKTVGLFRELGFSDGPSIVGSLGRGRHPQSAKIVAYLRAGSPLLETSELSRDVLSEAHPPIGTARLLTDGHWVWPEVLAFYVERYNVSVPAEMIAEMQAQGWRCPTEPGRSSRSRRGSEQHQL